MPNWLRWILMPPAAILSMVVIRWLNKATLAIATGSVSVGFFARMDDLIINGVFAIMGFMYAVKLISPTHKFKACVIMAILLNVFYVIVVTNLLTRYGALMSGWDYWEPIVASALALGTSAIFCVGIYKKTNVVSIQ